MRAKKSFPHESLVSKVAGGETGHVDLKLTLGEILQIINNPFRSAAVHGAGLGTAEHQMSLL